MIFVVTTIYYTFHYVTVSSCVVNLHFYALLLTAILDLSYLHTYVSYTLVSSPSQAVLLLLVPASLFVLLLVPSPRGVHTR